MLALFVLCLAAVPAASEQLGSQCATPLSQWGPRGTTCYFQPSASSKLQCCCDGESPVTGAWIACLPSVWIVGFQKAGTTALHAVLAEHPAIAQGEAKEMQLELDELFSPQLDTAISISRVRENAQRRVTAAHSVLAALTSPDMPTNATTAELRAWAARSVVLNSDPRLATHIPLIVRLVPNARIILLLREPAERAISHFLMRWRAKGFSSPARLTPVDMLRPSAGVRNAAAADTADEPPLPTAADFFAYFDPMVQRARSCALCEAPSSASFAVAAQKTGELSAAASALLTAALMPLDASLPPAARPWVLPCSHPAFSSAGAAPARAVWPAAAYADAHCNTGSAWGVAAGNTDPLVAWFALTPILQTLALVEEGGSVGQSFSPTLHVMWLEHLQADPGSAVAAVTAFIGVPPLPRAPVSTGDLARAIAHSSVTGAMLRSAWRRRTEDDAGLPPLFHARLQAFFEPFERLRREYFARVGLMEL